MTDHQTSPVGEEEGLPPLPAQHDELRARWECDDCDGRGHDGEAHWQGHFQPPEPFPCSTCGGTGSVSVEAYTAEQVRQAQRDAVASRDAEIADLRAQLEGAQAHFLAAQDQAEHYRARCAAPTQPKAHGSIRDDAEFEEFAGAVYNAGAHNESWEKSLNALIGYIDAWAGSRAGDTAPAKQVHKEQ